MLLISIIVIIIGVAPLSAPPEAARPTSLARDFPGHPFIYLSVQHFNMPLLVHF